MKAVLSFPYAGSQRTAELREDHRWRCTDPAIEQLLNHLCPLDELKSEANRYQLNQDSLKHQVFQLGERLGATVQLD